MVSSANSFSTLALMLSGPEALCGFMFFKRLNTPGSVMSLSCSIGCWGCGRGFGVMVVGFCSSMYTDLNCWLRMFALSLLLECKTPSCFNWFILVLFVLQCLIYVQNFFEWFSDGFFSIRCYDWFCVVPVSISQFFLDQTF